MTYILHDSPDEAVRERIAHLKKLKKEVGQIELDSGHLLTAYQWKLRQYIQEDPWFLFRAVMGMHWLCEDLHGRIMLPHDFIEDEDGNLTDEFDKAVIVPRGHVKTLMRAARQVQRIVRNPEIKILYASATVPLARSVGTYVSDTLLNNEYLQAAFPDILPASKQDCVQWGLQGYRLPCVVSTDPTFRAASLDTNVTGSHPWVVAIDDLTVAQNNNERGWEQAEEFIKNCLAMLPPHGFFEYNATRWHDADPTGKIINGEIRGKQGEFKSLVLSCYVDDDPKKGPIWKAKKRWGSTTVSGYTMKQLEDMRFTMGSFFNAQMRNDPAPSEEQVINYKDINVIKEDELPKHGECRLVGIEATGGGQLIYNHLLERMEKFKLTIPFVKMQNPKRGRAGLTKEDDIITELEPIVREGRLYALEWMMEDPDRKQDTLAYEIKRLGAAKHDDIVDALHNCTRHLIKKTRPDPREPNHFYIAVDLAFTESQRSDFSVCVAVSVDHQGNHYVHDYIRFKLANPTGLADRIIEFYQKHSGGEESSSSSRRSKRSFASTYR